MVKIFKNDNSGEFCAKTKRHSNSPELSLLKFLPLTYHHSHFLAATLDFTSFFTMAFLGAASFFTAWLFLIRYHFFLYLYTPKLAIGRLWGFFNLSFFFTTGRIKRQSRFLILQLFLILSVIIYYMSIIPYWITCSQLIFLLRDLKCS